MALGVVGIGAEVAVGADARVEIEEKGMARGFVQYLQPLKCILLLPCVMVYYTVLFLMFFWCPYMAINVNVQYNGEFLPDIILLTRCYLHRGTCLNAMKRFCICSL